MNTRFEQLQQLESENPTDAFVLYAIGLELLNSNCSEAERYFEKNSAINPEYLANYYQLGKLKMELNKLAEAKKIIEKGIELAKNQNNKHTLSELNFLLEDTLDLLDE